MRARKIAKFEVSGQRFKTGGGVETYIVTIDRDTGLMTVRQKRHRSIANTTLFVLAQEVMQHHYAIEAQEARRERVESKRLRKLTATC